MLRKWINGSHPDCQCVGFTPNEDNLGENSNGIGAHDCEIMVNAIT